MTGLEIRDNLIDISITLGAVALLTRFVFNPVRAARGWHMRRDQARNHAATQEDKIDTLVADMATVKTVQAAVVINQAVLLERTATMERAMAAIQAGLGLTRRETDPHL